MRGSRRISVFLVCSVLLPKLGEAQASPTASVPDAPSAVLFGTNTNLEGSRSDKGGTLGAVSSPGQQQLPEKPHKGEFAFAPIPMINPSIGDGGGAAVMYSRRLDAGSPPSSVGMGGFGTGRGSWGLGLGGRLYLKKDRYRVLLGGGGGEFNYNFFGVGSGAGQAGISIPLSQRSRAFLIEPKVRIFRSWYLGPRYHLITNHVSLGSHKIDPADLPIPLPADLKFTTAALGIRLQRDTSDNPFYPRKGSLFDLSADFFEPAFGADRSYKNLTISYDKYISVGPKNVFAIHGSVCSVSDRAPFFDVCELGMSADLRGYQAGQFRDDRMIVGQAEYRRELFWRLGAVAFAGAGAVGKTFGNFGDTEPGGGFGLRLTVAKRYHTNLRFDYAWGDNSRASYVSLGEAF